MNFEELNKKIIEWAKDREIHKKGTVEGQKIKTIEEIAELIKGICKNDIDLIKDSIGDVYVTLIVGSLISNGEVETITIFNKVLKEWENYENEEKPDIINWCGKTELEWIQDCIYEIDKPTRSYFKYTFRNIEGLWNSLYCYSIRRGTTLKACVQLAYDEIANRKGKIINGQFVKEEDL